MRKPVRPIHERKWFYPGEVAQWLMERPVWDIHRLFDRGELTGERSPGGHRRIYRESLAAYLKKRGIEVPGIWPPERPRLVLVVDDHAPTRRIIQRGLEAKLKHRLTIRTASRVREAQRLCETQGMPELVILDYEFPGQRQTGDRFIEFLKDDPKGRRAKIIALTAHFGGERRERLLAAGADEIMAKPFAMEILIQAVHRLLFGDRRRKDKRRPDYGVVSR